MKEIYIKPQIFEEEIEEKDIVTTSPIEEDGYDNDKEIDW